MDVGDDDIRMVDHPFVPILNSETRRDGFDPLRQKRVVGVAKRIFLYRQVSQNDFIADPVGLLKLGQQTWTNWLCDRNNLGNSNTTGIYNEVGDKPENYGGCQSLMLVANFATVGSVTIFDDDNYAILDVKSKSYKTYNNGTLSDAVTSGAAAITSDAVKDASDNITTKAVIYKIEASQKNDVNLEWTVSYPDGVTYDNVTLVLTKTDGQRSYTVGNIKAASDGKSGTFVLKVSEYVKGVYNAKISAWSAVKPNDPYTANIVLTIVD